MPGSEATLSLAARVLFEHCLAGAVLINPANNMFVRANSTYCQIVGYSEAELQQKAWTDITVSTDSGPDQQQIDWLLSGKISSYEMDKRYMTKRGHLVWVRLRVDPVYNEDGDIIVLLAQVVTKTANPGYNVSTPPQPVSTDLALAQWITANKPIAVAMVSVLLGAGAALVTLLKWLKGL